jgi:anti-anti-sigma factor
VDIRPCRGIAIVTVAGAVDHTTAAALRTALIDAIGTIGPRLVLDLLAVHTCDDAALAVIAGATVRARRRGGWLRIAAAPAPVAAVLQRHPPGGLTLHASVTDAIAGRERPRRRTLGTAPAPPRTHTEGISPA